MEETPEFIKKQFLEFRKIYRNWFKELSDTFTDSKKEIIKYYKEHMEESHEEILKRFFTNIKPYVEKISDLDYTFFENSSDFYSSIHYSNLMSSEKGKLEEFRKSQMTHLTKLTYMSILLSDMENQGESKEELEKYSPLLLKLLTNIQQLDGTNMENMMKNFENVLNPGNFTDVDKAFIQDNPLLSDLADEISKEVKIPDSFKNITNPQDIFKLMFDKEGKQFMEGMVKTVGNKIQQKIKSGKISEKDLVNQAQKMMGTVFKNNDMFSAMGLSTPNPNSSEETAEEKEKKREELKNKLRENLKKKRGDK